MQLSLIRLGDAAQSWADAGFSVSGSPDDGVGFVALGNTRVVLTGQGGGFLGWAFDGIATEHASIDGLGLLAPDADSATTSESRDVIAKHPNGITSIDHVVIDSDDLLRTTAALQACGFVQSGGRTTESYGSPMAQAFFWAGDVILELVGPVPTPDDSTQDNTEAAGAPAADPARADPATKDSAASLFGLALVSEDLDETAATLGELMGSPKEAVQPGRRIAGLRGRELGMALPIAVMSPHVKPD